MRRIVALIVIASLVVGVAAGVVLGRGGGSSAPKGGGYTGTAKSAYDAAQSACAQLPEHPTTKEWNAALSGLFTKLLSQEVVQATRDGCNSVRQSGDQLRATTITASISTDAYTQFTIP